MNSCDNAGKTSTPVFKSIRLLDQLRQQIRYLHYRLRTQEAYVYLGEKFVHFHGLKRSRDMRQVEFETFSTYLAVQKKVTVSAHRQALGHSDVRTTIIYTHALA